MNNDPEKRTLGPENNLEQTSESAREQTERVREKHERVGEQSPESGERQEHKARHEALESAISVEAGGAEKKYDHEPKGVSQRRSGPISRREKDESFTQKMTHVQAELSAPSRAFSKVIHNKAVEKVSDTVGSTIARPNAILAGSIAAFIITTTLYYVAKNIGYPLSGFETIGAFAAGWVIGILFDYFRVMITGKRS